MAFMKDPKDKWLNFGAKMPPDAFMFAPIMRAVTTPPTSISPNSLSGSGPGLEPAPKLAETPLDTIFDEIERALEADLAYAAVVAALTLPDICYALSTAKGVSSKAGYAEWYDKNYPDYAEHLSGEEVYKLRCGVLHQGIVGRGDMKFEKIYFSLGKINVTSVMTGNVINGEQLPDLIGISAYGFCLGMIKAARTWYASNATDPNVLGNSPNVVRLRPGGLPPYMVGMSVIA